MAAIQYVTAAAEQYLGHAEFCVTSRDGVVTGITLSNAAPENAGIPSADMAAITALAQALELQDAKASLRAHNDRRWAECSRSGTTVNIGTEHEPIIVLASTDADGKADILGLQNRASLGHDLTWYQSTGSISITPEQLAIIALAVATHVEDAIVKWAAVQAGIDDGSITTTAHIDASYEGE